jgi:hypothetical protein
MKRRSYIYEDIIKFLINRNLINEPFAATAIVIPARGIIIKIFLYKHSNINYKETWTLFFKRNKGSKPVEFKVDFKILRDYEKQFNLKLI